ncbi:hypothetical protein [Dasania marina]|uniref:hypothetical protein n=1 Tax=Dasania marina TaxID=471499 RepID=UPI0030DB7AF0|tara:strand:+ start:17142 stop:17732 length:591 start_codon:yes stop_codon:yes gene_type:complete
MLKTLAHLLLLIGLLPSAQSYAQTEDNSASEIQWLAAYGLSFGGADKVESLYNRYDDSFETSGLASLGAGVALPLARLPLTLETLVSVHFDNAEAKQGDANLDYKTIDVLSFYRQGAHRIGLGFSHHLNPRFKTNNGLTDEAARFNDTTGTIVEYNYLYAHSSALGVRLTDIRYTGSQQGQRINGSNISIFIKTFF